VRPLNAPIFLWLDSTTILKMAAIVGVIAAIMVVSDRKIRTARICAHEIYGSASKATVYRLGGCIVMFAGLWLFAVHSRH
jgi:hypothetical protein